MPKPSKSLVLCVHAHQPVGNFDHVFAEAFDQSYAPFFDVLERHPKVPMSFHFSGSLLDWIEAERPAFIGRVKKLVDRGQVEILGGAYYEPIYGMIPKRDLVGQIMMMREKIRGHFGVDPEGGWLTERVWDPDLVKPLEHAGIRYTVLDDIHFEKAGQKAPVTGYYRTQDGGKSIDVFASIKELRYLIPFRPAEDTVAFIRETKAGPEDAFVFADDCEKFGMWPGTHHWVFKEKWLDEFFTGLEKAEDIGLYTLGSFRRQFKAKRSIKIAHSSYSEMMQWSGGRFYNFFDKYDESRYMRERVWSISETLDRMPSGNGSAAAVTNARQALYKAQCNCGYWHGVFGGLYLHHLRSSVFENLIKAEGMMAAAAGHGAAAKGSQVQIAKLESGDRVVLRQKNMISFFNARYGAALEELDYVPKNVNILCTLQRRKEFYHDSVLKKTPSTAASAIHEMLGVKEENLEKYLFYDPVRRLSFMDHFFDRNISAQEFERSSYVEAGEFVGKPYKTQVSRGERKSVSFDRTANLNLAGGRSSLALVKTAEPKGDSGLTVRYEMKNKGRRPMTFTFGVEFNFSIGEKEAGKGLAKEAVRRWTFNDSWRKIAIELSSPYECSLLATPVETVSESESGLERTYQQLGILLQRRFSLAPGESAEHLIEMDVR
jgi:alpha-amylase